MFERTISVKFIQCVYCFRSIASVLRFAFGVLFTFDYEFNPFKVVLCFHITMFATLLIRAV